MYKNILLLNFYTGFILKFFRFTTLDLSIITNVTGLKVSCNITALQIFEPNNLKISALFAGLNLKKNSTNHPIFKYVPVSFVSLFFCS